MKIKVSIIVLILISIPSFTFSAADHSHKSGYAGEEKREIKSLSETDIEELKNGKGWGLGKAAELNGLPGPAHLLEMKEEIDLNDEQIRVIDNIYKRMKREAIPLGHELIELERELNNHFANRTITNELLHQLLMRIAQVYRQLRYVHLSAHLKTPDILRSEQITLTTSFVGTHLTILAKMCPKAMIPKCGKSITIAHRFKFILHLLLKIAVISAKY